MVKDNIKHVGDVADGCVSVFRSPGGGSASHVSLQGCSQSLADVVLSSWMAQMQLPVLLQVPSTEAALQNLVCYTEDESRTMNSGS